MMTYLACWTGWTFDHIRYRTTFDEFMMAYEYAAQLYGLHKPNKRKAGIDKDALKAEIEMLHKKVGK